MSEFRYLHLFKKLTVLLGDKKKDVSNFMFFDLESLITY